MMRAVLDSYIRGCIVGNLVDIHRVNDQRVSSETCEKIFTGEIKAATAAAAAGSPSNNRSVDISWHYMFLVEIYSLLECDPLLRLEPLNLDTSLKYLLVMRETANAATLKQLSFIFPPTLFEFHQQPPEDFMPLGQLLSSSSSPTPSGSTDTPTSYQVKPTTITQSEGEDPRNLIYCEASELRALQQWTQLKKSQEK